MMDDGMAIGSLDGSFRAASSQQNASNFGYP
jgi:hypothetical protein